MLIADIFRTIGHLWKLDSGFIQPDDDDVRKFLDEAASMLYDRAVGDRLESGGLIVEKRPEGFDVYAYLGNYI